MSKDEKIFCVLRKCDHLWHKKGYTFLDVLKHIYGEEIEFKREISDDELILIMKDICPDEKS